MKYSTTCNNQTSRYKHQENIKHQTLNIKLIIRMWLLVISWFLMFGFWLLPAVADVILLDVPDGHWASEAINDLVKLGVTKGFPDGTFRGKKFVTRYEAVVFIAKFNRAIRHERARNEKNIQELKSEVNLIKYKKNKAAWETQFSAQYDGRLRLALSSPRGGQIDHRVKFGLAKNFDRVATVSFKLDTLDSWFNNTGNRRLAQELISLNGKVGDYQFSFGPGNLLHRETTGLFSSDDNTVYELPSPEIKYSRRFNATTFSAAYTLKQLSAGGLVGTQEIWAELSHNFGDIKLNLRPRYIFAAAGERDVVLDCGINFKPAKSISTAFFLSAGSSNVGEAGYAWGLKQEIADLIVSYDKVGAQYQTNGLPGFQFLPINQFKRLILPGTQDLGLKFSKRIKQGLSLEFMGDYVTTSTNVYSLWQVGATQQIKAALLAGIYCRNGAQLVFQLTSNI